MFVFDLDGVIRHWDHERVLRAEREHGLPINTMFGTAFEPELLHQVVTGEITDAAWREETVQRLQRHYPRADARAAVDLWSASPGELIAGSCDAVTRAREIAPVVLLTNATDRLPHDMLALGIQDDFDHIVNSSAVGFAKPDQRIFAYVERMTQATPEQIVYVDDATGHVEAALTRGWTALRATPSIPLANLIAPYLD